MLITILLSFIFGIIAGLLLTVGSLLYLVKAKCPQCKKLKPFREIAVIDPNIRAISVSNNSLNMNKELQIKTTITDIETKSDKNFNPYFRLSLSGLSGRYFYAFSFNLSDSTISTLTNAPYNFINRSVLITYEELPNKNSQGTFSSVKDIQLIN
ncbi:11328_t:CDS:2 [Racocetra fulgida]|uniref:11328_t:CDS:1 n=1 Tax=Racocetra fulgida TaxID=60492 RepID=A0A9N8VDR2_9GLOM|nr:11328_t:CDS:2 [Racocetra fulgida]